MNLARKLSLVTTCAVVLVAILALIGYLLLGRSMAQQTATLLASAQQARDVASMRSQFQTQVQEWKNVLLRGSDDRAREKYWKAFQAAESEVAGMARKAGETLADGEAKSKIEAFATAHRRMGEGYRTGFEKFTSAGYDASVGDSAVRGMDREPNRLIGEAIEAIAALNEQAVADAESRRQRVVWASLAVIALAGLGGCAGVYWLINRTMAPLTRAVESLSILARGDLSLQPDRPEGSDEVAQVGRAMCQLHEALVGIVGQIRSNADGVATASAQIAQGNQDLSARTEHQASALQQTAATMEELSSTVRQNADNARQANQLAQSASTVAQQGGSVVAQVVGTMRGIHDGSRRIADIIGTIDGIAFQTNILALNAAVEAARAGEQGRGFAVVAGEVRTLAQRSAEAAREIKDLITASVEQVEQGNALAERAGATMDEVVTSIRRLTDIVGEISSASAEQSHGVAQVGVAVTQMDHATQQNAALVEQSTAAAESLKAQAQQLVSAVGAFRLAPSGTA